MNGNVQFRETYGSNQGPLDVRTEILQSNALPTELSRPAIDKIAAKILLEIGLLCSHRIKWLAGGPVATF